MLVQNPIPATTVVSKNLLQMNLRTSSVDNTTDVLDMANTQPMKVLVDTLIDRYNPIIIVIIQHMIICALLPPIAIYFTCCSLDRLNSRPNANNRNVAPNDAMVSTCINSLTNDNTSELHTIPHNKYPTTLMHTQYVNYILIPQLQFI